MTRPVALLYDSNRPERPMKHLLPLILALLLSPSLSAQPATPDGFIAAYAKEHNFNGSILIQKKGEVTFAKSFGLANIPFKVPDTRRTKYKIASITKAFTAVLILQLQEQGKIDLYKTIGAYLPDYAGEGAGKVTIHQLLNHTSGLANFDTVKDVETAIKSGIPVYQTPYTSDELLARFAVGSWRTFRARSSTTTMPTISCSGRSSSAFTARPMSRFSRTGSCGR